MTGIGIRLVTEPRLSAAGFFSQGFVPGARREDARGVTIPLQFMPQGDDEGMERRPILDLFDALGTKEKTLRAHLGGDVDTPWFEVDDGARFFARHLTEPGTRWVLGRTDGVCCGAGWFYAVSMRCPGCDTPNPAGAKFCGACGHAVGSTCPFCGAPRNRSSGSVGLEHVLTTATSGNCCS